MAGAGHGIAGHRLLGDGIGHTHRDLLKYGALPVLEREGAAAGDFLRLASVDGVGIGAAAGKGNGKDKFLRFLLVREGRTIGIFNQLLHRERPLQPDIVGGDNHLFGFVPSDDERIAGKLLAILVGIEGKTGSRGGFFKVVFARLQGNGDCSVFIGHIPPPYLLAVFGKQVKDRIRDRCFRFRAVRQLFQFHKFHIGIGGNLALCLVFGRLAEALPSQRAGDKAAYHKHRCQNQADRPMYRCTHDNALLPLTIHNHNFLLSPTRSPNKESVWQGAGTAYRRPVPLMAKPMLYLVQYSLLAVPSKT